MERDSMKTLRSILATVLLLSLLFGCAHQDFYQIPYSKIDSVFKPYDGWNFELDIFNFNIAASNGMSWGLGIARMNFFYKLAIGAYVKGGVPVIGQDTGTTFGVAGGGVIIEPVVTQYLKVALQAGPVALIPNKAEEYAASGKKGAYPGMEYAIGLFTAFHYRAGIDFYVAHGIDPDPVGLDKNPFIFAVRLHIIGFSYKAFSKDQGAGLRRLGDVPLR